MTDYRVVLAVTLTGMLLVTAAGSAQGSLGRSQAEGAS